MEKSPKTASVVTLGCPMNQVDSERIIGDLVSRGFTLVPEAEASVIVVNTCGFLEDACRESIDTILELAELKKTGKLKRLLVAGCLAQRYRHDLPGELPEVDAVFGLDGRDRIAERCESLLGFSAVDPETLSRVVSGPTNSAYLKIAEGCDNRCTYCKIPSIRGPYRSVPLQEVIDDAGRLVELGARELILIAQDTSWYGKDKGGPPLETLLEHLSELRGLEWIRIMYTHPDHYTESLLDAMASLPKVIPYLDIPIQHVASAVLKRMGRKGDPVRLLRLMEKLREKIQGLVLRTSLIVGFPGETEDHFQALIRFVKDVKFERLGSFVFSAEEGTPAALLKGAVPPELALERHERLMETQAEIVKAFHDSLVGWEGMMIVDEVDPESCTITGRTYMDAPDVDCAVRVNAKILPAGPFTRIRIISADIYDLQAQLV